MNFREAPGEGGVGALCDWAPPGTERVQRIAWLGASGVLHARLAPPRPQVPPSELDYLEEATLRPLAVPAGAESPTAVVRRSAHACPEQGVTHGPCLRWLLRGLATLTSLQFGPGICCRACSDCVCDSKPTSFAGIALSMGVGTSGCKVMHTRKEGRARLLVLRRR